MAGPYPYRTPDGDIDLEKAVGPHLSHYVGTMASGAGDFRVVSREFLDDSLRDLTGPHLLRRSYGLPSRASSSGTLAHRPEFCWDVCAYYLILGVTWRATKREIRLAYVAACARPGGQVQAEKLTYIVSRLLDDVIRRAYDMTELGGVFLWDRDVMEDITRAATREAVRRRLGGEEFATADEVMEEAGIRRLPPAEAREQARSAGREAAGSRWDARWGYYLMDGPAGVPRPDTALLEAWQAMVGAALRERGIIMAFAVAQGPEGAPLVLRDTKEPCIFIVTEKGTSPQKAIAAVEKGISLGIVKENNTGGI